MKGSPTVVSVFSGAGGLDWGFNKYGFEILYANEILEDAANTYSKNYNIPITNDINISSNKTHRMIIGKIETLDYSYVDFSPDILIGGPPCQDYSIVQGGDRLGIDGKKGTLYLEYLKTLIFLKPKIFIFENVPGIYSSNNGNAYSKIIDNIQNLDNIVNISSMKYSIPKNTHKIPEYKVIFANTVKSSDLGVPQLRNRVIIIGIRSDIYVEYGKEKIFSINKRITDTLSGRQSLFAKYPLTCIEIFEGKPLFCLEDKYKEIMNSYEDIFLGGFFSNKLEEWQNKNWNNLSLNIIDDYLNLNNIDQIKKPNSSQIDKAMLEHESILLKLGYLNKPITKSSFADGSNSIPKEQKTSRDRTHFIPPGANIAFLEGTKYHVKSNNFSFIYRRSSPIKPAWTVLAGGGGGTYGYHYDRNRSQLSNREKARIQTFSDDFTFVGNNIRGQIGEAVPPILSEKIAEILLEHFL